ncbi:hypothetical protein, conserved in T. vivax [Trypanosoma vivax Y486]|uniref:Uncharacterized protein n=1 Tax=Trypanosoma vivax (strain Y486) TaxID=1055687 RepID=F9WQW9_TRYVY|nr:hypothetical protein, conserved in T. vivax [Trypanosoma vivax Y486]|eukprot:CCD19951.1 hypothetical protein, conserved in T. vivax [Trypanosoma vivax Y486]
MAKKPLKAAAMERHVRKRKTQTEVQRIMPGEADRRRGGDSMAQRAKQCAGEYTQMERKQARDRTYTRPQTGRTPRGDRLWPGQGGTVERRRAKKQRDSAETRLTRHATKKKMTHLSTQKHQHAQRAKQRAPVRE